MMSDSASKKKAFEYKLGAAKYHLKRRRDIFKEHDQLFFKWSDQPNYHTPDELMPFFYHYDAFLYELHSCFDMILYYLSLKHDLKIPEKNIAWGKKYKEALKQRFSEAYEAISREYREYIEWWFEDLNTARNYVSHHDRPSLGLERTDAGITLLFFDIPGLHQRRELFEQCDIWGNKMSELFKEIEHL